VRTASLSSHLEGFWSGKQEEETLLNVARELRAAHWQVQSKAGITTPPSNNFSLYDHVLDTATTLGAVPQRFGHQGGAVDLKTYFAMSRGSVGAPAMEMTKWFDTNYHYVVPEFEAGMKYDLVSTKALDDYLEAKALGIETRPVLLGPVSFVLLGKPSNASVTRASVLAAILPFYEVLFAKLHDAGAKWVQLDEPCLCLDLDEEAKGFYREAFSAMNRKSSPKKMLTTYFGDLGGNLDLAMTLGVDGLHLDLVRAPQQIAALVKKEAGDLRFSLGLVDGRNVWRTDLSRAIDLLETAVSRFGVDRVQVAPSCSLLHSPVDLDLEGRMDPEIRS